MPVVSVRAGRAAIRPPKSRGRIIAESLVASGDALVTMYDATRGELCDRLWKFQTIKAGYIEVAAASWPSDATELESVEGAKMLFRQAGDVVYLLPDGSYAHVEVSGGWAYARISGPSYESVYQHLAAFQTLYPATYLDATADRVPVTFWTLGRLGPERRLRMIDSAPWSAVEANYPAETRGQVAALMDEFTPGKSGQLLLWQGPPGTGKTWALRALASQWLPWAEFHYITDPDSFFVDDPSYMIDVLLAETYAVLDQASGEVFHENAADGKWRVLILEDTGELLSANAKEKYGQGLSRLLNVVDGMIGQGLRVLCLVTTNDELGELNAAVRRPGRCAAQIVFPEFPAEEASAWLGEQVDGPMTVAEMYALRGDAAEALEIEADAEEGDDVPPEAEIARVVEEEAMAETLALAQRPLPIPIPRPVPAVFEPPEPIVAAAAPAMMDSGVIEQAFATVRAFAEREQPAPTFHIHLPTHALDVSVATPAVEVPLTVNPADIHVTAVMPDVPQAPVPDVHVHVPEQAPPTVDVHVEPTPVAVTVEPASVEVTVERPRPHAIRVERDTDGSTVYVPEELEEEESVV